MEFDDLNQPHPETEIETETDITTENLANQEQLQAFLDALSALNINPINSHGNTEQEFDESYFDSFPPGYRFVPMDSEIIVDYLMKKISKEPLPANQIKDVNFYLHSPDIIAERHPPLGQNTWYFFTQREKKRGPFREAGSGYWKATGGDTVIRYDGAVVGYRKPFVFYEGKSPMGKKTKWIMHEYRINEPSRQKKTATDMTLHDYVLCRMYEEAENSKISQRRNPIIEYVAPFRYPSQRGTGIGMAAQNGYFSLRSNMNSSTGNQIHLGGTNWASTSNGLQGIPHAQYLNYVNQMAVHDASTSIHPGPTVCRANTNFMPNHLKPVAEMQRSFQTLMQYLARLNTSVVHNSNAAGENTSPAMNNVQKKRD